MPNSGKSMSLCLRTLVVIALALPATVALAQSFPSRALKVIVPYFRSLWAFIDPTHRHFFSVDSFSYYDPAHENSRLYNYSTARFQIERVVFNETIRRGPVTALVKSLANRWPGHYELYLSHLYPLDDLSFYLRTLKP